MTCVCHGYRRPVAWILPVLFLLRLIVESVILLLHSEMTHRNILYKMIFIVPLQIDCNLLDPLAVISIVPAMSIYLGSSVLFTQFLYYSKHKKPEVSFGLIRCYMRVCLHVTDYTFNSFLDFFDVWELLSVLVYFFILFLFLQTWTLICWHWEFGKYSLE